MTVGEEYGRADRNEGGHRLWWLLQTLGADDRDFSDYWFGWHKGKEND